jgi:hypothetical protein
MEDVISRDWQWQTRWRGSRKSPALMTKEPPADMGNFSLRLAQEGEWVRIVSVNGGKGIHERLAGFGLRRRCRSAGFTKFHEREIIARP